MDVSRYFSVDFCDLAFCCVFGEIEELEAILLFELRAKFAKVGEFANHVGFFGSFSVHFSNLTF